MPLQAILLSTAECHPLIVNLTGLRERFLQEIYKRGALKDPQIALDIPALSSQNYMCVTQHS